MATVEDLLNDVDLATCLEQPSEIDGPFFGEIFNELDDLWKDSSNIAVPTDDQLHDQQPSHVTLPSFIVNGLQKVKTEEFNHLLQHEGVSQCGDMSQQEDVSQHGGMSVDKATGVKRSHPNDPSVDMMQLSKRQQKMLKNRQASTLSRQRKREYVATLETQLQEAANKNALLLKENNTLRTRIKILEQENHLLTATRGMLTPPRTPAMLAIVLFVTAGLLFYPLKTKFLYTPERSEVAVAKIHRALLSINENAPNGHDDTSRAIGPHFPDHVIPINAVAMGRSKNSQMKRQTKFDSDNKFGLNLTNITRLHLEINKCFRSHDSNQWYRETARTSALAIMDHMTDESILNHVISEKTDQTMDYFFRKCFSRNLENYYLVSFQDHVMFNAVTLNKTQPPKLSVIIPYNDSTITGHHVLQMDCAVMDTKLYSFSPDML